MNTRVKLGATLFFDSTREKDIIELVDSLRATHKLGNFINNTIKFAYEHKDEFMAEYGSDGNVQGLSEGRDIFYKKVSSDIQEMRNKVDKIYAMAHKMYILTQFNKTIGLEERSKNLLMAQFVAESQINELCKTLGISQLNTVYASDKLFDLEQNTDDIIEFIINYYDGIVNEIKSSIGNTTLIDDKLNELSNIVSELENSRYVNNDNNIKKTGMGSSNQSSRMSNSRPMSRVNNGGSSVRPPVNKAVEAPKEEEVADIAGIASLSGALL